MRQNNRKSVYMRKVRRILMAATAFAAVSAFPAAAYNYGPGMDQYSNYDNNPAYNTGWQGNVGPGYSGQNPMGNRESYEDRIYAKGPGSEAVDELLKETDNTLYIHTTCRSGVWEQTPEGKWKLKKENGQYVSSEWAYLDGKTYLLDMYGTMLTGWQRVNDYWYYFNSVGAMQTGWLLKEGKYYFLNTDGSMAYGWVNTQGAWYYMSQTDGSMLTNTYTPDGRYVNAEGILV